MLRRSLTKQEESDRASVSAWVKDLITRGATREDLAKVATVSPQHVSKVKYGSDAASPRFAAALVAHFPDAPESVRRFALLDSDDSTVTADDAQTTQPAETAPAGPIASALSQVHSHLSANIGQSQRAVRRVVECAERYALAVEQAQAHRLLVFCGVATGAEPSAQDAALALYDALLGVPELAALLAQPATKTLPNVVTVPVISLPQSDEPAPQRDPYDVVVAHKADVAAHAPELPSDPVVEYPALARASQRNPLIIIGGTSVPEVRSRLAELGVQHEWVETRGSIGQNRVEAAANRIRRTNACAAMVLHGFEGHKFFDKIRDAARLGVVPFIAPRAAGSAELVRALHALDRQIANGVSQ